MKSENPFPFKGLNEEEVKSSRMAHGRNTMENPDRGVLWTYVKEVVMEPMFLILLAASSIYFLLGDYSEGFFLLGAIAIISGISVFQNARSRKALNALKEFTQTLTTVIRDNELIKIKSEEIVVGDVIVVEEGELVTADGILLQINDFSINEAILTGEAFGVVKVIDEVENNQVFSGTAVISGQGVFKVTRVGKNTELGKIETSLSGIKKSKSPLQAQISKFVKQMALWGGVIFLIIWLVSFYNSRDIFASLLLGLTIAMSVLPEEIPVAFTTFMTLGAYRLMKLGIIVKHTQTIETLGSATVLCTDKTGTITQNKMELSQVYAFQGDNSSGRELWDNEEFLKVITVGMWASEKVPFDPMEKSLHSLYQEFTSIDERLNYEMIHEYPLGGKPPMMTHIYQNSSKEQIIAVKGAPEALLAHSNLSPEQQNKIAEVVASFASKGLRVLGVGEAEWTGEKFPKNQEDFNFQFLGLLGFYDPPKNTIKATFKSLEEAGINVKIITGDNTLTTLAIAKEINFKIKGEPVTGEDLIQFSEKDFDQKVRDNNIFTRIFPEVKLNIIKSLKRQKEIVGMTGDGVNDAPALKAAHIGIAMGMRGSEVAKESSSLVLSDDDFAKMVDAVAMGRKIYFNLKKAVQYIISIHIPIILTVALPLVLGWVYPVIFTPVHVIFLELIMGPTCSIIYENEPLEKNAMKKAPRAMEKTFLQWKELSLSILQGLVITAGCLLIYQYSVHNYYNEDLTRTMVFSTLIIANIFLTLVNRSFYYSFFDTLKYKNPLIIIIISVTFFLLLFIIYFKPIGSFFKLQPLLFSQLALTIGAGLCSVIWFEFYKFFVRLRSS